MNAGGGGRRPTFHLPRLAATDASSRADAPSIPPQTFQPLPPAPGAYPYRLDLSQVIGAEAVGAIAASGEMVFHTVGDTGGVKSPEYQEIVSRWMEADMEAGGTRPSFFYHLGDLVYYAGEIALYYDQFYEPYAHYPAPILAIPGNHDGDLTVPKTQESLEGFMRNFCATQAGPTAEARDVPRAATRQPNCYWTLLTPLATIIGLYTNCPEHGQVESDQEHWFQEELAQADKDKALIVALHHPPYSADDHHGASLEMRSLLERCFKASKRRPDIVLTAHVHNYQRFSVPEDEHAALTYVVAGAGGYWHLHDIGKVDGAQPQPPWTDPVSRATLEAYNREHRHGFLRLTVSAKAIQGVYTTVPNPQESWSTGPVQQIDSFTIDLP
jgi:hypothetical protein